MIKMVLSQPEIKMKIAPAKVVYQGGEAYEGTMKSCRRHLSRLFCRRKTSCWRTM